MATKPKSKQKVTISVYMDRELFQDLIEKADRDNRSVSQVAALLIAEAFSKREVA